MSTKTKNIFSLILNLIIFADMVYIIPNMFFSGAEGNMTGAGWRIFRYYTIDSNILCAAGCLTVLYHNVKGLKNGSFEIPQSVLILKFCGTVAVTVTFLVVLVFLGPTLGYRLMFGGVNNLFMHGLNPIMALAGFLVFERGIHFPKSKFIWGDLSVAVYGTLYFFMVIVFKCWEDFYGFATVLKWWISYPVMIIFGYFLSYGMWKLYTGKKKTVISHNENDCIK